LSGHRHARRAASDGVSKAVQLIVAADSGDPIEWPIEQTRANEAGARIFWPLGDTRLIQRLDRITAPTLLLWGENDRVIPRSCADRFAQAIGGETELEIIDRAVHLAELDQFDQVARAILRWTE
jgi:pimeloyl-ACP methyl ester carboxylesterase